MTRTGCQVKARGQPIRQIGGQRRRRDGGDGERRQSDADLHRRHDARRLAHQLLGASRRAGVRSAFRNHLLKPGIANSVQRRFRQREKRIQQG